MQSIKVGSSLLDALAEASGPIPLNELSRLAEMQPSKARRYLISFLDCGLVEQNPTTGHYDLGPMALRLGFAALSRIDPIRTAVEAAGALSRKTDRTILVSVWTDLGPVIIAWFDSSEILACNLRVGSILPLTNSASGKLFLSYLPRKSTRRLVEKWARKAGTNGTLTAKQREETVERIIEDVHRRGIATTEESLLPGLSAVAAPVFDSSGNILAVIAEIHKARDASFDQQSIGQLVVDTAAEVSTHLGYQWQTSRR